MHNKLNDQDKQRIEADLRARREVLAGQQSRHLEGVSRVEHAHDLLMQDGDDVTQHDAERELDFARTDRDAVELREIDQALARLADGRYGLCADCGTEIPAQRLQLSPQALRCVNCASRLESGLPRAATL